MGILMNKLLQINRKYNIKLLNGFLFKKDFAG